MKRARPKSEPVDSKPRMPRGATPFEEKQIECAFTLAFTQTARMKFASIRDTYEYIYRLGRAAGKITGLRERGVLDAPADPRDRVCEFCGSQFRVRQVQPGKGRFCGYACKNRALYTTHGHNLRSSSAYRVWFAMRQRCNNPNNSHYANYGGRGITVCERWRSFENFFSDMGQRPKGRTLDRINNERGYSPDNCRWATYKQQSRNMRRNRVITHEGLSLTAAEWSDRTGIPAYVITARSRSGWPDSLAVTAPVSKHHRYFAGKAVGKRGESG